MSRKIECCKVDDQKGTYHSRQFAGIDYWDVLEFLRSVYLPYFLEKRSRHEIDVATSIDFIHNCFESGANLNVLLWSSLLQRASQADVYNTWLKYYWRSSTIKSVHLIMVEVLVIIHVREFFEQQLVQILFLKSSPKGCLLHGPWTLNPKPLKHDFSSEIFRKLSRMKKHEKGMKSDYVIKHI